MLPIFACVFGCAPPVIVSVEASATSPPAIGSKVFLEPFDPRIPTSDPNFAFLSKIVDRALMQEGMQPVGTRAESSVVVGIGWRMGAPQVTIRQIRGPVELPTDQVRGSSGSAFGPPPMDQLNPGVRDMRQAITAEIVSYPWTVELKRIDASATMAEPVWRVTLTSVSESKDLASIAPEMIAGSLPFIGQNSAQKTIKVSPSDATVKSFRQALSPSSQATTP